jgi:hypothetical protein
VVTHARKVPVGARIATSLWSADNKMARVLESRPHRPFSTKTVRERATV